MYGGGGVWVEYFVMFVGMMGDGGVDGFVVYVCGE